MSGKGKENLEELKKSFPSLDELSASKLLGGNHPDNPGWGDIYGEMQGGELNTVVITRGGSGGSPTGGGSGGSPHGGHGGGGGGGDYFGDWDWGDGYDDFGWDEGWGDDQDGGTDPNPGGPEGDNEQNSSGNPGGQQPPDYAHLPFFNSTTPSQYPHRTYNNSSVTLYGKPENDTLYDRVTVPPNTYTDEPLDAFKLDGHVFKVTDGYGTLEVTDDYYQGHYSNESILWFDSDLERMQGWLNDHGNPCHRTDFEPGDIQWDNIFSPP